MKGVTMNKKNTKSVEKWGVFDASRWDAFYKWLGDEGLVTNNIPAGTGFTNDYLS